MPLPRWLHPRAGPCGLECRVTAVRRRVHHPWRTSAAVARSGAPARASLRRPRLRPTGRCGEPMPRGWHGHGALPPPAGSRPDRPHAVVAGSVRGSAQRRLRGVPPGAAGPDRFLGSVAPITGGRGPTGLLRGTGPGPALGADAPAHRRWHGRRGPERGSPPPDDDGLRERGRDRPGARHPGPVDRDDLPRRPWRARRGPCHRAL